MAALVLALLALLFIISGYMGNLTSLWNWITGFIQCFTADVPQWLLPFAVVSLALCGAGLIIKLL